MDLKGKVVVVTGGARDIGREISIKLAVSGAKVGINYFDNKADAEQKGNHGTAIQVQTSFSWDGPAPRSMEEMAINLADIDQDGNQNYGAQYQDVDNVRGMFDLPMNEAYLLQDGNQNFSIQTQVGWGNYSEVSQVGNHNVSDVFQTNH